MRQVLQNLRSGATEVEQVPAPMLLPGHLLIATERTLISAGTERTLVEFARANIIDKARQQPDKVRMVLDKVRTDGLLPTLDAVRGKLDQPMALGYCNFGRVIETGAGITGFAPGDRVASNGTHAEIVSVPSNLTAKVPDTVSSEEAAFTVIGAIALQGIRLVQPTLGEAVVVMGLGLVGLLTVQLLRAQGCRVLGLDFDRDKLALARSFGAETADLAAGGDPIAAAHAFSRGRGVDAVIVTASTRSNEPIHQAAVMCRKRGRIVLVGVAGLELSRADFYEKELTFQVSCSYGPGRYDPAYEHKGQDYPIGFVRWTEQRNFEAVLDQMSAGRMDVKPLISHRFSIEEAARAYDLISSRAPSLGVMIEYPPAEPSVLTTRLERSVRVNLATTLDAGRPRSAGRNPTVAFIGSGNYASSILIPAFKNAGARLLNVVSSKGVSGLSAARKYGFEQATTDTDSVITDPAVSAVVISTRHDSHAHLVCRALRAGKAVFVEKPLAIREPEIDEIVAVHKSCCESGPAPLLMVGFNRRFAPHVVKLKSLLEGCSGPKSFIMTVNSGAIPGDSWVHDPGSGGGRLVGEACHFVDLLRHLAGAPIVSIRTDMMSAPTRDTASLSLTFADGSIGTVHYFANGARSFPKERLEIFAGGRILQLDNFRKLVGHGWPGMRNMGSWRQDKGQNTCALRFIEALREGKPSPIHFDELIEVARATIAAAAEPARA